jgi:CheY-like chemotaxis protein
MVDGSNTILVVEDDPGTRAGLVEFLESEGFPVLAAENGRHALDLLASVSAPPRLILLDLMMPVMDGWQFLAARRRQPGDPSRTAVVLLSGLAYIEGAKDVADFLRKPIDPATLRACVRRFCGSAGQASA